MEQSNENLNTAQLLTIVKEDWCNVDAPVLHSVDTRFVSHVS
jgi:hypothetical protein